MTEQPSPRRNGYRGSIWLLTMAPGVWAIHFLLSYLTAAIWCAKHADPAGDASPIGWAIATYTTLALVGIAIIGWKSFHQHRWGASEAPHDSNTADDQHRFLGFSTFLLSLLSAVATIFTALVFVFVGSCH